MTVPPGSEPATSGNDDPWAAFGYLAAGVLFYGVVGWLLSLWLHHDYWIPIGLLVGLALGMYMVLARYRYREPAGGMRDNSRPHSDGPDRGNPGYPDTTDDRGDSE
jgi:ATP synthase protein I